jgi:hypothetical protein
MWSKELIDAFDVALQEVTLEPGFTKATAIVRFLDAAARMAVWRVKGDSSRLEAAYFTPFTPIGHLTFNGMGGGIRRLSIGGPTWGEALDLLKVHVRENAEAICQRYRDEPLPYPHDIGFG